MLAGGSPNERGLLCHLRVGREGAREGCCAGGGWDQGKLQPQRSRGFRRDFLRSAKCLARKLTRQPPDPFRLLIAHSDMLRSCRFEMETAVEVTLPATLAAHALLSIYEAKKRRSFHE